MVYLFDSYSYVEGPPSIKQRNNFCAIETTRNSNGINRYFIHGRAALQTWDHLRNFTLRLVYRQWLSQHCSSSKLCLIIHDTPRLGQPHQTKNLPQLPKTTKRQLPLNMLFFLHLFFGKLRTLVWPNAPPHFAEKIIRGTTFTDRFTCATILAQLTVVF